MRINNGGGFGRSRTITPFDIANSLFFIVVAAIMVVPFLNVITLSLEPEYIASVKGELHLFPKAVTLVAYKEVFSSPLIIRAFLNSVYITAMGGIIGTLVTAMFAYGIADRTMMGVRVLTAFVVFTMMFRGGIIPLYLLMRQLGLLNTLWSIILPLIITGFNIILMRSFFRSIPRSVIESATIDGANHLDIFFRIILPLSMPIISTIFLFIAVDRWNSFFDGVLYISDQNLRPLQVLLREFIIESDDLVDTRDSIELGENIKMATVVLTIVPILLVYPFLQKYFTKGIMLGAIKG